MTEKTLSVSAIKEGTVVDHITSGCALKIIHLLKLADNETCVTVGLNLKSRSMGFKDLIKIENFFLDANHAAQIAIFAPRATVNVIKNYQITQKIQVQMPQKIESVLRCPNSRCITNIEQVATIFTIDENDSQIILRCRFCEKLFGRNDIKDQTNVI